MSERVLPVSLENELRTSYLEYAMSVIIGRALPDVRDGLKPVHRRIIYAMHELGLRHEGGYRKSARVVGEVLGKFHPHGDMAVYDALVKLAQPFYSRYPLIEGHGNFGSIDGDNAAAMRYTEVRLSEIGESLILRDLEKGGTEFQPNFDNRELEPTVFPCRLPMVLLNGSTGIAVGMATNIPPHSLKEVCDTLIYLIEHEEASIEELMRHLKGPDFPTGGEIIAQPSEITQVYRQGRGGLTVRGKAAITRRGKQPTIEIYELPYMVMKSALLEKMASLAQEWEDVSALRDESDREGMRIVLELKRDAQPEQVLQRLYDETPLQTIYHVNLTVVRQNQPEVLGIKDILLEWLNFRENTLIKLTEKQQEKDIKQLERNEGLKRAIGEIKQIVSILTESESPKIAEALLGERGYTPAQVEAIINLPLRRLTQLETQKLEKEIEELNKKIEEAREFLESKEARKKFIIGEISEIKERYQDERKTVLKEEVIVAERPCWLGRQGEKSYRDPWRNWSRQLNKRQTGSVVCTVKINENNPPWMITPQGRWSDQLKGQEWVRVTQQAHGQWYGVTPQGRVVETVPCQKFSLPRDEKLGWVWCEVFPEGYGVLTNRGRWLLVKEIKEIRVCGAEKIVSILGKREGQWYDLGSPSDELISGLTPVAITNQGQQFRTLVPNQIVAPLREKERFLGIILFPHPYVIAQRNLFVITIGEENLPPSERPWTHLFPIQVT